MEYPEDLNEDKVMKKWREAIQQAPSLISSIFKGGKLKVITKKELFEELKKRGISYDDTEDVIGEAERKKLILLDYKTLSAYLWIPSERREKEKRRTEKLEGLVEKAFMEKGVEELSENELKEILTRKGLSVEEVERALLEAERDCILSSYPFTKKGWMYELIPSEDRARELECRRLGKLYTEIWLYEKHMYGFKL
jgi:SOS response regulatory protein OraA/RecX